MRKANREITNQDEIIELIQRCDTVRIGIQDEPFPYIVPVSYGCEAVDGQAIVYIHGAVMGKKQELLAKNPNVCLEGDIFHGYAETEYGITCHYESFIGYGQAERVLGDEAVKGLKLLLAHCDYPDYPVAPAAAEATAVYKIILHTITGKRNL